MAKAYDRAFTRNFVTSSDRKCPPAEQSVFKLAWMSIFDYTAVEEMFANAKPTDSGFPKLCEIVRRCLRGWTNFKFPDGRDAPFVLGEDGLPTLETVQLINPHDLVEIATDCDKRETVTPDEVGKS